MIKKIFKAVLFLIRFIIVVLIVDIVVDLLSLMIGTFTAQLLVICILFSLDIFVFMELLYYIFIERKNYNNMRKITILPETTKNPITLMGARAGVCWGADISNNEKNYKRGLDCIKSGHGRVMEYVNVEMIIDGYSAKVLREYYTHIGGSPTRLQASTRYINYSKGNGFDFVIPKSIEKSKEASSEWYLAMTNINHTIADFIKKYNIPVEDATMLLPLAYSSKMVDKRNLRSLIDMSRVRMCSRAYWEYRELFKDICNALREYSDEWKWIVDNLFHAKCDEVGYCTESKSCGRKPKRQ